MSHKWNRLSQAVCAALRGAGRFSHALWTVTTLESNPDLLVIERARAERAKAIGGLLHGIFSGPWKLLGFTRGAGCPGDDSLVEELCRLDDVELLRLRGGAFPWTQLCGLPRKALAAPT
jgi:hypothetical protein